jgi:hypothetical protein
MHSLHRRVFYIFSYAALWRAEVPVAACGSYLVFGLPVQLILVTSQSEIFALYSGFPLPLILEIASKANSLSPYP